MIPAEPILIVVSVLLLVAVLASKASSRLGVPALLLARRQYPLEFVPTGRIHSDLVEVTVPDSSPAIGKQILELRLPKSALVVLVGRNDDFIVPGGSTILQAGDTMLVLSGKEEINEVRSLVVPTAQPSADKLSDAAKEG